MYKKAKIRYYLVAIAISIGLLFTFTPAAFAADVCSIGGSPFSSIKAAIDSVGSGGTATITVLMDSEVDVTCAIDNKNITIISGTGGPYTVKRAASLTANPVFSLSNGATLTLQNVVIDGGAVWSDTALTAAAAKTRTNSGVKADSPLIEMISSSTLNLESGAVIENVDANDSINNEAAVVKAQSSTINMKQGSVIQRCGTYIAGTSSNCSAGFNLYLCTFNMTGGTIQSCYLHTGTFYGGTIVYASNSAVSMSGNAVIRENTQDSGIECATLYIRSGSTFNMSGNAQIYNNESTIGTVMISGGSTVEMSGSASIHDNDSEDGGGVKVYSGTLTMLDSASILNNTATVDGGGINLMAGATATVNLIGGSISGNTAAGNGDAIFHEGTTLNLNAAVFAVSGNIYLNGDGTGTAIDDEVVTLVGAPTGNTYTLETASPADDLLGRVVAVPGSVTVNSQLYSLGTAYPYAAFFSHTTKGVIGDGNNLILGTAYTIAIDPKITGGTVTSDRSVSGAGGIVTATATPKSGYRLTSIIVSRNDTMAVIPNTNGVFTMPAANVTITAVFATVEMPETGDGFPFAAWLAISLAMVVGIVSLAVVRRTKR